LAIAKVREEANEVVAANDSEKQRRRLDEAIKFSKYHLEDVVRNTLQLVNCNRYHSLFDCFIAIL